MYYLYVLFCLLFSDTGNGIVLNNPSFEPSLIQLANKENPSVVHKPHHYT